MQMLIVIGLAGLAWYYWGHHDVPFENPNRPPDDSGDWLWCPEDRRWYHISEYQ